MDRTTKILLAAIALGLWANAGVSALRPAAAQLGGIPSSHLSHYDAKDLASATASERRLNVQTALGQPRKFQTSAS